MNTPKRILVDEVVLITEPIKDGMWQKVTLSCYMRCEGADSKDIVTALITLLTEMQPLPPSPLLPGAYPVHPS